MLRNHVSIYGGVRGYAVIEQEFNGYDKVGESVQLECYDRRVVENPPRDVQYCRH